MFLTPIERPEFTGMLSLYKTGLNFVWKDLYTERQKLYYIYYRFKDNLSDVNWIINNENIANTYDYYNRYLKLAIGDFDIDDNMDFIAQHDWTYYDKLYDNGKKLKVNSILQPSFELYILIRNNILKDINSSNLKNKIELFNIYSPVIQYEDETTEINNYRINLKALNYYFKTQLIPFGDDFNKYKKDIKIVFWQNDRTGDITNYIDETFTK